MSTFQLKRKVRHQYSRKTANLAVTFCGYASNGVSNLQDKSISLAIMSALYDLVSDYGNFSQELWSKVKILQFDLLSKAGVEVFEELMARKQDGGFKNSGLSRGIDAVKIIYTEFDEQEHLADLTFLNWIGIRSQIVDDLVDFDADSLSDHLNYLKCPNADSYTRLFLESDFEPFFDARPRSDILRYAFAKAKKIAVEKA